MDIGSVPQWITVAVAIGATAVAYHSIRSQREIARKRAAVDFFTKTEMDKHTLDQHKAFKKAIVQLAKKSSEPDGLDAFVGTKEYWELRDYLNLHELMSVGIKRQVFDDHVCYDFWSGELARAYNDTGDLIRHIRTLAGEEDTYCELVEVRARWAKRDAKNGKRLKR